MNLFVVGRLSDRRTDSDAAIRALRELLGRLPFFDGCEPHSWSDGRVVLAWVAHSRDQVGEVSYVVPEPDGFALFAGRPFVWADDGSADGGAPLDPRFYRDGIPDGLDGRWAAARYDGARLEVTSDAMGAYPLYKAQTHTAEWWSNNPELARTLAGDRRTSEAVLASLLGGGWSLSGDPVWAAVHRAHPPTRALLPVDGRFDADRAAARLTAATAALAGWPGRADVVPVTGGRDSRLVLAAALAAGVDFTATTGAVPGSRDLEIGRRLAEAAGVPHEPIPDDPHGSLTGDWRRAAELIELTAGGTSSLSDAAGYPFGPRPGPLPLWHSGQGGEIARSYYGLAEGLDRDALADRLYRSFVGRRAGRSELLSGHGATLVREEIERFIDLELGRGVEATEVPDAFYLERRMGTWAGPTHGCVEYVRDTTSPLWSHAVASDALRLDAHARAGERFHVELLRRLAPALMAIPYEDGTLPGARPAGRLRRARSLTRKIAAAARRRLPARDAGDPFDATIREVRELVRSQPDHPAWSVLERSRVDRLLEAEARQLDTMSRYYVWRLATAFSLTLE